MASASFLVNGVIPVGPQLLSAGSTVLLALADISGAANTQWSFIGTSEDATLPTITLTGKGTASFVMPAAPSHGYGLSLMLQCVNAGQTAKALFCVGDDLMVAANETTERSAIGGWAWQWNENLRSAMATRDGRAYLTTLSANATWALTGAADIQNYKHVTISSLGGANRAITLTTTGALLNDSVELVFPGESSAYSLTLSNGSTTLATLESYRNTTVKLWFNGTAWVVTSNEASPLAKRAFTTALSGATAWYIAGAAGVTGTTDLTISSLGGAVRTLTLWETRAVVGDKATLTYLGSDEGYALTLNAGAGGTLATLPAWQNTRVELYYTGTAWAVLSQYTIGGGGTVRAFSGTLSGATAWYLSGSGTLDGCRSVTVTGLGGSDRTLTLWETYAVAGDEVVLRYTGTANILTLAAGAGGTLATLLPGRDNEVVLTYSGSAWAVSKLRRALVQKAFVGAINADATWSLAGTGTYAGCTAVVASSLNADHTLTLDTAGAVQGDIVTAYNNSLSYDLIVSGLTTLRATLYEHATLEFDGAAWQLIRRRSDVAYSVQTNEYTTAGSFTWTKPAGKTHCKIVVVGGGGGGGNGNAGGIGYGGGGGGGSGLIAIWEGPLAGLGATETVIVGAGGAANSRGGMSSVGTIVYGLGGGGSSTTSQVPGDGATATNVTWLTAGAAGYSGAGGGGAGQCGGGGGGQSAMNDGMSRAGGGAGGGALYPYGGSSGAAGGNGVSSTSSGAGGAGGGRGVNSSGGGAGGAANVGAAGSPGNGGQGYGGGGGGGGGSMYIYAGPGGGGGGAGYSIGSSSPSGSNGSGTAGGAGAVGYVLVTCW